MGSITGFVDRLLRHPDHTLAVTLPGTPEPRLDLAAHLVQEGWPKAAITGHAVALFADAVLRRYVRVHGHQPPWDRGWVYEGYSDWLLIYDTYQAEIGAIAERLAFEGTQS